MNERMLMVILLLMVLVCGFASGMLFGTKLQLRSCNLHIIELQETRALCSIEGGESYGSRFVLNLTTNGS